MMAALMRWVMNARAEATVPVSVSTVCADGPSVQMIFEPTQACGPPAETGVMTVFRSPLLRKWGRATCPHNPRSLYIPADGANWAGTPACIILSG